MKKRLLAAFVSLCMAVGMLPAMAFAADGTDATAGLCEHHPQHDETCGYTEGTPETPCAHQHTDDCYTFVTSCTHTHDETCGYAEGTPETPCAHQCSEESGCVIKTLNCQHQHDESCGYAPAAAGTPCGYVCEICSKPAGPQEQCSCTTLCAEGSINPDCPVCAAEGADLSGCKGTAPALLGPEKAGGTWTYDKSAGTLTNNTDSSIILKNVTANGTELTIGENPGFAGALDLSGTITDKEGTSYTITAIGDKAFYNCFNLTSINLPASVETIGDSAFWNCRSLETIDLSGCTNLTAIGGYAFYGCESLKTIDLSGCTNLTAIGDSAFILCDSLTSIDLSGCTNLTAIGDYAFVFCDSLTSIDLSGCTKLTAIGNDAFSGCMFLETVDLSGCTKLTAIGNDAFSSCKYLTSIDLSGCTNLTTIGTGAFSRCTSLTSITLPDGLSTIGGSAFYNCSSLTDITLPAGVTTIGLQAFTNCTVLTSIKVENGNQNFCSVDGVLFDKNQTTLIQYPAGKPETAYTVPNTVTTIGNYAFCGCSGLTDITLLATEPPALGSDALYGCDKLETIWVPAGSGEKYKNKWSEYADKIQELATPPDPTPEPEPAPEEPAKERPTSSDRPTPADPVYDFWNGVRQRVRDARPGDTVRVSVESGWKVPSSVLRALAARQDVALQLDWEDGESVTLTSGQLADFAGEGYFSRKQLAQWVTSEPAQTAQTASRPAPATDKENPVTGGGPAFPAALTAALSLGAAALLLRKRS